MRAGSYVKGAIKGCVYARDFEYRTTGECIGGKGVLQGRVP